MVHILSKDVLHICAYCKRVINGTVLRRVSDAEFSAIRAGQLHTSHGACTACSNKIRSEYQLSIKDDTQSEPRVCFKCRQLQSASQFTHRSGVCRACLRIGMRRRYRSRCIAAGSIWRP